MKSPRKLRADEIELRAQQVMQKGAIMLMYKDARVDMNILDETYGIDGWQRTHEVINGNLFCNIEIWDERKSQWIKKQDVGIESNQQKEKGEASDSFKRAGFNVGIGRELYTKIFIWINLDASETDAKNGKYYLKSKVKFHVSDIGYQDGNITHLVIKDAKGKIRFALGQKQPEPPEEPKKEKHASKTEILALVSLAKRKGIDMGEYAKENKLDSNKMTYTEFIDLKTQFSEMEDMK